MMLLTKDIIKSIFFFFFFSSRRRHTRLQGDWSSDVCSSDLPVALPLGAFVQHLDLVLGREHAARPNEQTRSRDQHGHAEQEPSMHPPLPIWFAAKDIPWLAQFTARRVVARRRSRRRRGRAAEHPYRAARSATAPRARRQP